eukprot:scaffold49860_cov48-Phaeocystis_antarctica.AAC.1
MGPAGSKRKRGGNYSGQACSPIPAGMTTDEPRRAGLLAPVSSPAAAAGLSSSSMSASNCSTPG